MPSDKQSPALREICRDAVEQFPIDQVLEELMKQCELRADRIEGGTDEDKREAADLVDDAEVIRVILDEYGKDFS
jgi:hypothetical protein